jgi:hypothetical protein
MVGPATLVDVATAAGATATEIPRKEAWRLFQAWCEVYCAPIHGATGKWAPGGIAWATFSGGYFPSIRGRRALDQYHAQEPTELLVLAEDAAIRCTSNAPVDFSGFGDVYVAPSSFEWTMAFTHEEPEYGPYFARADWRDRTGSSVTDR